MENLIDSRRPNVWIAFDGDQVPKNLHSLMGLVILFRAEDFFETDKVYTAELALLYPGRDIFNNKIRVKAAFLPKEPNSFGDPKGGYQFKPALSSDISDRNWEPITEFQDRLHSLVISIGSRASFAQVFDGFGIETALRLLLLANELSVLNERRPNSRILQRVRRAKSGLWTQFFREDEERFSLITFSRFLKYQDRKTFSLADVELLEADVPLWGGEFELRLRLVFPSVLGQRQLQNVIIGPNGSGKSNLLYGLGKCVSKNKILITEKSEKNKNDNLRKPISIAVFTYEPAFWKKLRRKNIKVYRQGVQTRDWRNFTRLTYELGIQNDDGHTDVKLLSEILSGFIDVSALRFKLFPYDTSNRRSWYNRNETEISLQKLCETTGEEFHDIVMRMDCTTAPFMRANDKNFELSSGERSLALFCVKLLSATKGGALVLIDEPENHLHPKFITTMVQTLTRILQATESRALLVTHSPFVVREFDRSTVKVLKVNDGVPELFKPTMQTLGGDVSMICAHVFEDDDIKKGFELSIDREIRKQSIDKNLNYVWKEKVVEGLGMDAIAYLIYHPDINLKDGKDA